MDSNILTLTEDTDVMVSDKGAVVLLTKQSQIHLAPALLERIVSMAQLAKSVAVMDTLPAPVSASVRRRRCPTCNELFHPYGYATHVKACKGHALDEALAVPPVSEVIPELSGPPMTVKVGATGVPMVEVKGQSLPEPPEATAERAEALNAWPSPEEEADMTDVQLAELRAEEERDRAAADEAARLEAIAADIETVD